MDPQLMTELNRQHIDDLQRAAAAERLARPTDRAARPVFRQRFDLATAAAGASVAAALLLVIAR